MIESLYCSERIRCYIVGNSTIIFRKSQDDYYTEIDKFYLEQLSESNKKLDEELVPIIESVILRNKIIFNNCIQYFWDTHNVSTTKILKDIVDGNEEEITKYGWTSKNSYTTAEQEEITKIAMEYLNK